MHDKHMHDIQQCGVREAFYKFYFIVDPSNKTLTKREEGRG